MTITYYIVFLLLSSFVFFTAHTCAHFGRWLACSLFGILGIAASLYGLASLIT